MKKNLILFAIVSQSAIGQNLLKNPGFENGYTPVKARNQFNSVFEWSTFKGNPTVDWVAGDASPNLLKAYAYENPHYESAEEIDNSNVVASVGCARFRYNPYNMFEEYAYHTSSFNTYNFTGKQIEHRLDPKTGKPTGKFFMGMNSDPDKRVGIQQELPYKLPAGKYLLTLNWAVHTKYQTSKIEVYLSTEKNREGNDKKIATLEVEEDKGDTDNGTVFLEPGKWYQKNFEIKLDGNDVNKYKWIIIMQDACESLNKYSENSQYIFLDDIKLQNVCEMSCYPTSGIPSPTFSNNSTFLDAGNLNNIESATLEIFTSLGQGPIWSHNTYNSNGIQGQMHWYGVNNNGYDVANAYYIYKLTTNNECGQFVHSGSIVKPFNLSGPYPPQPLNYSGPKIPKACCIYDLTIENQTLTGTRLYSVVHDIIAGPAVTVENGSNIKFEAGNRILLRPGFKVNPGASFIASIVPCSGFRLSNSEEELDPNTNPYIGDYAISESEEAQKPITITGDTLLQSNKNNTIVPNPNTGSFTLISTVNNNQVFIYDLLGNLIHHQVATSLNEQIDISSHPKGIYFVKIQTEDGKVEVQKVVYQ